MKPLNIQDNAPWKARFRAWRVSASISHQDAGKGLLVTNESGVFQLYRWNVNSGEKKQLTFYKTGKPNGFLSPDARYVYYLEDNDGNEIGHLVRVAWDGGDPENLTPDFPLFSPGGFSCSYDGSTIGFMQSTREGFRVYVARLEDQRLSAWQPICHLTALSNGPILSGDGRLAVIATAEHSGTIDRSLLVVNTHSGERLAELVDPDTSITAIKFSNVPEDTRLLAVTNRTGFQRPLLWDPVSGERIDFDLPEFDGDLTPSDWNRAGNKVMLRHISQAQSHHYLLDIETTKVIPFAMPDGTVLGASFDPNDAVIATTQSAAFPNRVYRITTSKEPELIAESAPVAAGTRPQSIHYESEGGLQIQAWLTVPPGDGPFPTILETHGGPSGVTTDNWSPKTQAWIDHGFAVLSINYRGSITFGKDFQKTIQGNLGGPKVEDMLHAHRWLVEQRIAKPNEIFLTGWSYGGYLTLQALGKHPELWAGGMAGIAIADWRLMYEDQNENLRQYQKALFEGSPEEKPEQHAASSPITWVEALKAPVLIIQGRNDTRCPARQMEAYVEKLEACNKAYEIIWFDAGHGSYATDQNIQHQQAMLKFAYRTLGKV
jgi:dipeptidyl aminopeptidase/acylaminoacyl peptidase